MLTEPLLAVMDGPVAASAGVNAPAAVSAAAVTVTAANRRKCAAEFRIVSRSAIDDSFFPGDRPASARGLQVSWLHHQGGPCRAIPCRPVPGQARPAQTR